MHKQEYVKRKRTYKATMEFSYQGKNQKNAEKSGKKYVEKRCFFPCL